MRKEMTRKEEKICARGTFRVAYLKGDLRIDGLVALSYNVSKPFYINNLRNYLSSISNLLF